MSTSSEMTGREIVVPDPLAPKREELQRLDAQAAEVSQWAHHFEIESASDFEEAAGYVQTWRNMIAARTAFLADDIDMANRLHKSLTGKRRALCEPIEAAVALLERKLSEYRTRIEREARRTAEEARKRLEAEAKARQEAEALEAAAQDDEVGFQRAQREARAPVALPQDARPAAIAERAAPKQEGMAYTTEWVAEFDPEFGDDDAAFRALLAAIAAGEAPATLVSVDWVAARRLAKASAGEIKVPGLWLYGDKKVTVRRR